MHWLQIIADSVIYTDILIFIAFTKILSPPKTHVIHCDTLGITSLHLSMQEYAATHGYIYN